MGKHTSPTVTAAGSGLARRRRGVATARTHRGGGVASAASGSAARRSRTPLLVALGMLRWALRFLVGEEAQRLYSEAANPGRRGRRSSMGGSRGREGRHRIACGWYGLPAASRQTADTPSEDCVTVGFSYRMAR